MQRQEFADVFDAIAKTPEEAANLKIRSELIGQINQIIIQHQWTQQQAAEKLGVKQPRISELRQEKIDLFSIDWLVGRLARLGHDVVVTTNKGA